MKVPIIEISCESEPIPWDKLDKLPLFHPVKLKIIDKLKRKIVRRVVGYINLPEEIKK